MFINGPRKSFRGEKKGEAHLLLAIIVDMDLEAMKMTSC